MMIQPQPLGYVIYYFSSKDQLYTKSVFREKYYAVYCEVFSGYIIGSEREMVETKMEYHVRQTNH